MITIDYNDLELAFEFVGGAIITSASAYISRETGKIYLDSDDLEEELPEDIEDFDLYAQVPSKVELGLGKPLALRYTSEQLPENYREVADIFSRSGAYHRFKRFLESRGRLQDWYNFEQSSAKAELTEWAKSEGFSVSD